MINPNAAAMFKWSNNFAPGVPNGSQDFLQLIRQSDGAVLGYIDPNGVPQGSLAVGGSSSSAGARVLQGSANESPYVIASSGPSTFVDIDATNLKTTITVPVGSILLAFATVPVSSAVGVPYGFAIAVDGQSTNYVYSNGTTEATEGGVFSFSSSFVGDGASHTVSLRAASNSSESPVTIDNYTVLGAVNAPTLTLILVPSI